VDLYAEFNGTRVAIEIELGVRRLLQDVRKAETLGVHYLVVVTATPKVAALARRRLETQTRPRVRVRVLPFGLALKFLSQVFSVDPRTDKWSETDTLMARTDSGQAG
jgi:hypothetical protein